MAEILTLMSGKGGSGKTTLALSLTKLLLECNLQVLLVDCDLATNGATYFFESKYNSTVQTTRNILLGEQNLELLEVQKGFYFIPTSTHFPYDDETNDCYNYNIFVEYLSSTSEEYDIVICDCQAGYSMILEKTLTISNVNLIIMEPDAISSSSVRVLYAQVPNYLESSKTYQIFNKITREENKIYNKVFAGTIFTSLPSIIFNWDVRKAFAYSQVPEIISTNTDFGKNVYEVAKIIFPKLTVQLHTYEQIVLLFEQEELESQIAQHHATLSKFKKKSLLKRIDILPVLLPFISSIVVLLGIAIMPSENILKNQNKSLVNLFDSFNFVLISLFIIFLFILSLIGFSYYIPKERKELHKIETTKDELKQLERRLSQVKANLE